MFRCVHAPWGCVIIRCICAKTIRCARAKYRTAVRPRAMFAVILCDVAGSAPHSLSVMRRMLCFHSSLHTRISRRRAFGAYLRHASGNCCLSAHSCARGLLCVRARCLLQRTLVHHALRALNACQHCVQYAHHCVRRSTLGMIVCYRIIRLRADCNFGEGASV